MQQKSYKKLAWEMRIVLILLAATLIFNLVHYAVFRDVQHIFLWNLTDLAFLPISVLVMTILIDRLFSAREAALRLDKLNMLIGAFFSNVGTETLSRCCGWDVNIRFLHDNFGSQDCWDKVGVRVTDRLLRRHSFDVSPDRAGLINLRMFLAGKMDFLMRLLENPNLLEHEAFTDLLRAVFHLAEELESRNDLASTPDSDVKHLAGDVKRAYSLLMREWIIYMIYLKANYPYLFSLSVRTNPLDKTASPVIRSV